MGFAIVPIDSRLCVGYSSRCCPSPDQSTRATRCPAPSLGPLPVLVLLRLPGSEPPRVFSVRTKLLKMQMKAGRCSSCCCRRPDLRCRCQRSGGSLRLTTRCCSSAVECCASADERSQPLRRMKMRMMTTMRLWILAMLVGLTRTQKTKGGGSVPFLNRGAVAGVVAEGHWSPWT